MQTIRSAAEIELCSLCWTRNRQRRNDDLSAACRFPSRGHRRGRDFVVLQCKRSSGADGCAGKFRAASRSSRSDRSPGGCESVGRGPQPIRTIARSAAAAGNEGLERERPRYSLTPGLFDAGEASEGMKHLLLLKKPEAFQLGTDQPDDPKVQKTIAQLGIGGAMVSKMPKEFQLVIAQSRFSNSDMAFEGNHLFQGNFYHQYL